MEHFINIIYKENADSNGIAECIASGSNILTESSIDFYTGELDTNEKIITMELPEAIKDIDSAAQDIAMRLFEFGLKDFDIEITEDETITRTLRRGMRGEDVKRIQREIGMPAAEQDGIFGPKTERAVRAFQQNSGIQVDGVVGRQTQSAILKYRNPGRGISIQTPGPAYIDTAPQKTQPSTEPSELRKRKERERNQKVVTPPERKVGDLAQLPKGVGVGPSDEFDKNDPRNGEYDSGYRKGEVRDRGQPFAVPQMPDGYLAFKRGNQVYLYDPQGNEIFDIRTGNAAVGALRRNARKHQAANSTVTDKPTGTLSKKLDQKGATPVDVTKGSPTPKVSSTDIEQPVSDPDENEPRSTTVTPKLRPGSGDPNVNGTGPGGLNAPGAEKSLDLPDVNDKTQRQNIQQQKWEKKYGSAPRDLSAGLPAEFTTQYLNPALDDLTSDAAGDLASEVKGAPPPVARLVMDRMKKMLDIEDADEILDMAREIEQEEPDQASALSTLAEIYKQLEDTAMPKDESVAPRPKGAFMFRERNEWNAQYRNTHNIDGTPKQLTESIEDYEVTYEDDDKFYEDYGVMWYNEDETIDEAEYQGRKVKLGKPMKGDVKKFKVYVKNPKGNVVKVNFGQKGVKIKKDNPNRRRSFRARHNCDNPGPRHKARYWSCRKW